MTSNTSTTARTPITAADELYTHQLPVPALETLHQHPNWGDRCYHQLFVDDLVINAGRQLYANDFRRYAYLGVANGEKEYVLRAAERFEPGDDPNQAQIGGVRIEVVRPLEEIRLIVEAPDYPVALDLTYTARFAPVAADRHRIEQDGVVVTDYLNYFQSGRYTGTIEVAGKHYEVKDRAGFRDRGWGLRKHEASGRRGFMMATWAEFPNESVYVLLYETVSGRQVLVNGWILDDSGVRDEAVTIEHDLEFDGTLLTRGQLRVGFRSGASRVIDITVHGRNFLAAVGYSLDPAERVPGVYEFDIQDPAVIAKLDGQNDNGSTFVCAGVEGYGYVETGVGWHDRYRPEQR
jgi:hypothetical protein